MRMRICDLKRYIRYFEDSGCGTNFGHFLPLEKSCILRNHLFIIFGSIFSVFVPFLVHLRIIKDKRLDSFPIRTVRFEPQQESYTNVIFENRIGLGSEKTLSNHLWHLLAWSWWCSTTFVIDILLLITNSQRG